MNTCKKCNEKFFPVKGLTNYCSLKCRNSRTFSEESRKKKRNANLGTVPWNKGKIISTRKSVTTTCEFCGEDIVHKGYKQRKYHADCWLKASGGYRKGSGVGKKGWYKGYWCDSSYELVWVIYNLEHGIEFSRNSTRYQYEWLGETYDYIPDFECGGTLIEIKGYSNDRVQSKLNAVPNLTVLFKEDLLNEFEYVIQKYGNDFIRLYEGNPYNQYTNTCKVCKAPCKRTNVYCSRKCTGIGNNRNSIYK